MVKTSTTEKHDEFIQRTNRMLGMYLALFAWRRDLQCVALGREDLCHFWDIQTLQKVRIDWLKHDVRWYFPFVEPIRKRQKDWQLDHVFLSHRELTPEVLKEIRAERLTDAGFPTEIVKLPSEAEMLAILDQAVHGLADLPIKRKKKPLDRNGIDMLFDD